METKRIKRLNQITLIAFTKTLLHSAEGEPLEAQEGTRRNKKEQEGTRRNKKYNVNEYSINK